MPYSGMGTARGWGRLVALLIWMAALVVAETVLWAPAAQAQSGVIREIRVVGNKRVEPETVRTYLKFNAGDAYDPGKIDQSIRALFATGLFADVRIDREGNGVVIQAVDNDDT